MKRSFRLVSAAWLALTSGSAVALEAGDKAPAFSLQGSDGRLHRLADHVGERGVVLAWFPRAFTPG